MSQISISQKFIDNLKSKFFLNSFWGVFANLIQNIFFSLFFVIVARRYNSVDFSSYILANTVYGLVLAFSSLGLGQWFVRKLLEEVDKEVLIHQFFKLQCIIGVIFYGFNILLAFILYKDHLIRQLSVLIGINVIFDNIIYVIKYINIAQLNQKKTFVIQTVESLLKFMLGCVILLLPVSMSFLALMIITLRFLTLNIFLQIGTKMPIKLSYFLTAKIDTKVFRSIIINNWPFIVIGSISVLFWKLGNILIANYLTLSEVAHYEISFKLFSMAEVVPVIVSTSIFPILLKKIKEERDEAIRFYKNIFLVYTLYGFLAFTFIYSFSDYIIPWLFGIKYIATSIYCKEMFLTMIIFPTAILQANLLVALRQEKVDMWLNLASLVFNILFSIIGLYLFKTITVINLSILFSFLIFHLLQDYFLIKSKIISLKSTIKFYLFIIIGISVFFFSSRYFMPFFVFLFFWIIMLVILYYYVVVENKKNIPLAPVQ